MPKLNQETGRPRLRSFSTWLRGARSVSPPWALLFLLLGLAAACTPSTASVEPVTLVFAFPEGPFDPDAYEKAAAEFTAQHPHITIDVAPNAWETADVILGPEWVLRQAQQENQLLSLDALIEQEKSFELRDFYPGAVDQLRIQGELWGIRPIDG